MLETCYLLENAEDWEFNWRLAKTLVSLNEPETKTIARAWQFNPRTNLVEYLGPPQERSGADIEDKIPPTQIWRKMEDESTFYRLDFGSPTFELGTIEMELDFGLSKDQMEREFGETGFVLEPSKSTISRWKNRVDNTFAARPTSEFELPAPFDRLFLYLNPFKPNPIISQKFFLILILTPSFFRQSKVLITSDETSKFEALHFF